VETAVDLLRLLLIESPWALLAWPTVVMLGATLVGYLLGRDIGLLAIVPRTGRGLAAIFTAPFMHGNLAHLAANLAPFLVLGALVLRHGERCFVETAVIIVVGSGFLVWLLARRGAHMGMSGVVFGFFGYLLCLAYVTRRASDLAVAAGVLLFYGGLLAGIKPAREQTSWEGHLFGLLVGVAKAWLERH
jgi:membrane associated rhomboid family serine protease